MTMPKVDKNLDQAFKKAFEGYSKTPPASIWTQVNKALWIKRLVSMGILKPSQIIPFYSTVAVLVTVGTLLIVRPDLNNKTVEKVIKNSAKIENKKPEDKTFIQPDRNVAGEKNNSIINIPVAPAGKTLKQVEPVRNLSSNVLNQSIVSKLPEKNTGKEKEGFNTKLPPGELSVRPVSLSEITNQHQVKIASGVRKEVIELIKTEPVKPVLTDTGKNIKIIVKNDTSTQKTMPQVPGLNITPVEVQPKNYFSLNLNASILKASRSNPYSGDCPPGTDCSKKFIVEENGNSWSAGIIPEYTFGNYFVQSGLSFNHYQCKVYYSEEHIKIDTFILNFWNRIWVPDSKPPNFGHWEFFPDTRRILDTNFLTHFKSGTNSYSFLEIPLIFGLKLNSGKLNLKISTGISVGFYLDSKGVIFTDDKYTFRNFDKNTLPFNKIPLNFLCNAGLEYKLNDQFGLQVGYGFKTQLNYLFEKSYEFYRNRYFASGISFGVNYRFKSAGVK